MDESTQNIDLGKAQKAAAALIASTLCNGATEAFLGAQAGLLRGVETAMTEWLHRREEAIADAHRLVARMQESRDISEMWNAQQEWAVGALRRFAADATVYPTLFTAAGWRASETTKQSVAEVTPRDGDVLAKPAIAKVSKNYSERGREGAGKSGKRGSASSLSGCGGARLGSVVGLIPGTRGNWAAGQRRSGCQRYAAPHEPHRDCVPAHFGTTSATSLSSAEPKV